MSDNQIKIDKDIPPPNGRRGRRPELRDVLKKLEVGDSFFYPDMSDSFRGNCYWRAAYAGIKVTVRRVRENEVEGVRIWRVE